MEKEEVDEDDEEGEGEQDEEEEDPQEDEDEDPAISGLSQEDFKIACQTGDTFGDPIGWPSCTDSNEDN